MAFLIGSVIALYISLTTFLQMPFGLWLALHKLLIIVSLGFTFFIGYRQRAFDLSFTSMLLPVALFFSIMTFLYLGSYALTTAFFADRMAWIPFFYRDFNYHGFNSVTDYLNHKNNFRELFELQVFSFLISSVMYFGAGCAGYGTNALFNGLRSDPHSDRSAV
jgi:hypothetical protein